MSASRGLADSLQPTINPLCAYGLIVAVVRRTTLLPRGETGIGKVCLEVYRKLTGRSHWRCRRGTQSSPMPTYGPRWVCPSSKALAQVKRLCENDPFRTRHRYCPGHLENRSSLCETCAAKLCAVSYPSASFNAPDVGTC